jgi:hypothetical protein
MRFRREGMPLPLPLTLPLPLPLPLPAWLRPAAVMECAGPEG